jgi:hypothetical protein
MIWRGIADVFELPAAAPASGLLLSVDGVGDRAADEWRARFESKSFE